MAVRSFLSSDWYRVAPIKPRLRGHVDVHRQVFRGDIWYILQDFQSGKYHRITPAANYMLSLMNGRRTMHEVWEAACEKFDDDPPTQSETIRLLSQLHTADLIASDLPPDMAEIGKRHSRQERQTMIARIKNPMALRLPLFDPDRFLGATVGLVGWLFTPFGFVLWLALVLSGLVLLGVNWETLTSGFTDQALAAENLIIIALAYPIVKAIHELGHGYATKVWGGEVHEIGVMFLVFIPVPYVDASASAAFDNKWRRAVVGGAGIMVELALASIALIFWLNAEPGLIRAFAFNVMLIGGVSTLLFNGNPLLRFDGYFVLADLVEIPNLGQRANKYFFYLIRRYVFGLKDADSPVTAKGERRWLLTYSIAAFVYRIFISFAIALFVASKFFFIGIALALWALFNTFAMPLWKGLKYLFTGPELRLKRGWAMGVTGLAMGCLAAFLLWLPFPYVSVSYGVVWLEPEEIIRAETDGFVEVVQAGDGSTVETGDVVIAMTDNRLASRLDVLRSRLQETEFRRRASSLTDQVQTQLLTDRVGLFNEQIAALEERQRNLSVLAPATGSVVLQEEQNLKGRLVRQGEVLGYVVGQSDLKLRVAIPQSEVELVRSRTEEVELLFLDRPEERIPARVVAEVPRSENTVPSQALLTEGGGDFVLNPAGQTDLSTIESVFQFEVAPLEPFEVEQVGERALVKFDHGYEPLGFRAYRAVRQLFLRQFRV
ncbi:MAG: PqqD family peptide modification chaperone [Pseudomonadota bacterium]